MDWEIYDAESGEKAAALLQRSVIGEQCLREPLVLHSDNGAPMKSVTLLSKMYEAGITPSRGRPRVSNDNPYSESLFRTLKYCPQWPQKGFTSLDGARARMRDFMRWYTNEHRHSSIRFVTPAERHRGLDHKVLARRHELYERAKEKKPERWSGQTRNWGTNRHRVVEPRATGREKSGIVRRLKVSVRRRHLAELVYDDDQLASIGTQRKVFASA